MRIFLGMVVAGWVATAAYADPVLLPCQSCSASTITIEAQTLVIPTGPPHFIIYAPHNEIIMSFSPDGSVQIHGKDADTLSREEILAGLHDTARFIGKMYGVGK